MLKLSDVCAGYGRVTVLDNVSLEARDSEILAIIGLNGSGKSTILKTALGLIKVTAGEVSLGGQALDDIPIKARTEKITFLESQTQLMFPMTVAELLNLSARRHPAVTKSKTERSKIIKDALAAVDLEGFEDRNLLELSSGECRRAFIAHTLCTGARVTMLDEPFAHLDWRHQRDLVESLKAWNKIHSTTFVLAVHELEWAAQIAHRIAVVNRGEIIACDTPEKVFASRHVREVFAFGALIDENPIDGSRRLTLGRPTQNL